MKMNKINCWKGCDSSINSKQFDIIDNDETLDNISNS